MNLFVMGLSYRTCPESIREKASMIKRELREALKELYSFSQISEVLILSTCNRCEIYVISDYETESKRILRDFFVGKDSKLDRYLFFYSDREALTHLFRVTAGLDSMILFEDQILGQVKEALNLSETVGTVGKFLSKFFRESITFSKKVKTEFKVSERPISLSATAVKFIKSSFQDNFRDKHILVIGSGEMGQLALKHLKSEGFKGLAVTNRTYHPGDPYLTKNEDIKVIEYKKRYDYLNDFDVIISATASAHTVITKKFMPVPTHPVLFIDLALPKDIDRSVVDFKGVDLKTIDDFKENLTRSHYQAQSQLPAVLSLLEERVDDLEDWKRRTYYDPLIARIDEKKQKSITEAVQRITERLNLNIKEQVYLNKILRSEFDHLVRPLILAFKDIIDPYERKQIDRALEIFGRYANENSRPI